MLALLLLPHAAVDAAPLAPTVSTEANHTMIVCPLDNASRYWDIKVLNSSAQYCSDVTVRQCRDQSGCVGQKYAPNETLYEKCGIYTNPNHSYYPEKYPSLPVTIRVDADPNGVYKPADKYDHSAAYLEFVCDPQPGVIVDTVVEFWPGLVKVHNPYGMNKTYERVRWPKKLSTNQYNGGMVDPSSPFCMGTQTFFCPTANARAGQESEYCCISCMRDDGVDFVWNMTIDATNCKSDTKLDIIVQEDDQGVVQSKSTCVYQTQTYGENYNPIISPGDIKEISIPLNNIIGIEFIPMHDETRNIDTYSTNYGLPKKWECWA